MTEGDSRDKYERVFKDLGTLRDYVSAAEAKKHEAYLPKNRDGELQQQLIYSPMSSCWFDVCSILLTLISVKIFLTLCHIRPCFGPVLAGRRGVDSESIEVACFKLRWRWNYTVPDHGTGA
jgi:hypothetical protein